LQFTTATAGESETELRAEDEAGCGRTDGARSPVACNERWPEFSDTSSGMTD
jgi:hypothetical protein